MEFTERKYLLTIFNNSEDVNEKQATFTKWIDLLRDLEFSVGSAFLHFTIGDLYFCGNRRGRPTTSGSADFEGGSLLPNGGWRTVNARKVGAGGTGEVQAAIIVTEGCI